MQPKQAEDVRSVLLAFGMIDSADATGAVLAALLAARHRPERIDIAIGVAAPHRAAVEAVARDAGCVVHVGLQDVDALVSQADVVISAGGVSLLERMAAGVVNMAVAQNDLQAALIGNLAARGAVVAGGQVPGLDHGAFATAFDALCEDARRRHDLVAAGRALVDGRGAERVARHLTEMAA